MEIGYVAFPFWIVAFAVTAVGFASGHELGVTHVYKYETQIFSGDETSAQKKVDKDVGYRISADAHVTTVWENPQNKEETLIKIKLEHLEFRLSKKDSTAFSRPSNVPVYVETLGTDFGKVYSITEEDSYVKNLHKGIASILHFRKNPGEVTERDVSGTCNISYISGVGNKIEKIKKSCERSAQAETKATSMRSATVNFSSRTTYELGLHDVIQEANVDEKVEVASNLWKERRATIRAKTKLEKKAVDTPGVTLFPLKNLDGVLEALGKQHKVEFSADTIIADSPPVSLPNTNLAKLVKSYQKSLRTENLARLTSASAFMKLLKHFQVCSKSDVQSILDNKKLESIMPQILDLVAFGGSSESTDLVLQTLQDKGQLDLMERFLLSLSLVHQPKPDLIQILLKFLSKPKLNEKIKASVISTIGGLMKSASRNGDNFRHEVVTAALEALERGLAACTTDDCSSMYLRGLRNAARPSTMPLLMATAEKGGRPAFEALQALKDIGFHNRPLACEMFCHKILHQAGQDTSMRAVAFDILLDCSRSSKSALKRLLATLALEKQSEYGAFIASKLAKGMEQDRKLRSEVLSLLSDKDIKNYFSLYQEGASVSFVKPLIYASDVNSTYGVEVEMMAGGLLKRSSFNIDIQGKEDNLHLISVGIFADGLGSFVGESNSGSEEESPRAGLELSVLGVALRPYIFFESTSELMGHVWSGTASEPTTALQGNFLVSDHSELVVLQNGLNAHLKLQGVLSADLSGAVQISIWNRNSNSQVQNEAAFLMIGSASIETLHDIVEDEVKYRGQITLDFLNSFEFYEAPYKMCLQMIQPEFKFLNDRKKSVSLADGKFLVKRNLKSKMTVPAKSYALHPQNAEHCSRMLSDDN